MIENLIPKDERRELSEAYKLRSKFWATSVCAHIVWIFVATQIHLTPKPLRPIYDEFIRPLERRALIYRPPVKKPATSTPETRVGKTIDPRGAAKSLRTIIATAPNARSQRQIIVKPVDLPEIKLDVPAPNVVARIETTLPPPPPKVQAKQFTAPTRSQRPVEQRNTDIAAALPDAQVLTPALSNLVTTGSALPKIAPKQFTPPPPSPRQPKLETPVEVAVTLTPVQPTIVSQAGGPSIPTRALPPAPKTPPKQFKAPTGSSGGADRPAARSTEITASVPSAPTISNTQAGPGVPALTASRLPGPPRDAPPSANPTRGNDQANIAVASVNPNPAAEVPKSSRSGQFSVAPVIGEPSSGAASPSALVVPNLTVRDPVVPKPDPLKSTTVIYSERVRSSATGAFTVPLRPANRSIPRSLDARFAGRSVYTVLVPIENFPAYGGDWILWFAEITPLAGQNPSMKAPVPFRKIELIEKGRESASTRIQIAVTLGKDGKLSDMKVLSTVPAATQDIAIEDVSSWEWKPATRNGVPIDIEAVFEIPFHLPQR